MPTVVDLVALKSIHLEWSLKNAHYFLRSKVFFLVLFMNFLLQ